MLVLFSVSLTLCLLMLTINLIDFYFNVTVVLASNELWKPIIKCNDINMSLRSGYQIVCTSQGHLG